MCFWGVSFRIVLYRFVSFGFDFQGQLTNSGEGVGDGVLEQAARAPDAREVLPVAVPQLVIVQLRPAQLATAPQEVGARQVLRGGCTKSNSNGKN